MRLLQMSCVVVIAGSMACSSSEEPIAVAEVDAGRALGVDAGRDATVEPAGPLHPTPRCTDPKPAPGVYVPPISTPADAGADGSTDAGADAGADSGEAGVGPIAGPIRPLRLPSSGGPVIALPRWVPVFFDDSSDREDLEDMLGSIGCTDYWRAIASDYGVGEAISAPSARLSEAAPTKISDDQIQKWLAKQIKDKTVEAPTPNTVYVIFYPETTVVSLGSERSCNGFGGYHNDVALGNDVYAAYAIIPRCGNFERITSTLTHELIEAATDPYPQDMPAYQTPDDADLPWSFVAGGEVGDLCTFIDDSTYMPDGYPYTVQRSFSNKASVEGHDPCVPASRPYFYAAPSLESSVFCADCGNIPVNAIQVPKGTSKRVDVTLGSDSPVGVMNVDVVTGASLHLSVPSGTGSTYVLDKKTGSPGEHLQMTVTASATANESEFFALTATRLGHTNYWYGVVVH